MNYVNGPVKLGQRLILIFGLVLTVAASCSAQELTGIKCVMNGDAQASADASAEYKDAKVYFCCDDCKAKFEEQIKAEDSPLAIKANHQLVLTGQYVQIACPLTGKDVAEEQSVDVGGAKIGLCCGGCLKKVSEAENLAAKAVLVFSNVAFEKGFKKKSEISLENVKCLMVPEKAVSADVHSEHNGHQVFFCCKGCQAKFEKDPAAHTASANHQIALTGQVAQVACPISGSPVDDEQSTEVGGVTVKYCCGNCKAKMESSEPAEQVELAFGEKAFAKAFK